MSERSARARLSALELPVCCDATGRIVDPGDRARPGTIADPIGPSKIHGYRNLGFGAMTP